MAKPPKFITKKAFKQWLKDNPEKVCIQKDAESCPLAEATGFVVTDERYTQDANSAGWALPAWAVAFVEDFDSYEFEDEDGSHDPEDPYGCTEVVECRRILDAKLI